ncbi:hypothetical protein MLD38_003554 [Melastoma candidum]|uniref:Uncharacterized protein n=1 Tax=Melastoma candidum TaxID=119954 RepID=A0ACB9S2Y7_9MYRT|nr:hypothetical protein MLD38_003554 [Melastoma candidum]
MFRPSNRAVNMWGTSLSSAFRTSLACTLVGIATLYGPSSFQRVVALPAFSYVTVILVVTDATVGDTLMGCWHAALATAQTLGPAMLSLYLIGPMRLSSVVTAILTALAAFAVVVIRRTHVLCKRIALGQIVLIYVRGFIMKEEIDPIMHPLHVAASTAVGVLACVLAVSLPFPRLATYEVRQNCEGLLENASTRLKLSLKAASAEEKSSATALVSRVKLLAVQGGRYVKLVKQYQESAKWETFPFKWLLKSACHDVPGNSLEGTFGVQLRGMQMALASTSPCRPYKADDPGNKTVDQKLDSEEVIQATIQKFRNRLIGKNPSSMAPENKLDSLFDSVLEVPRSREDLSSVFFLFCLKLLHCSEEKNGKPAANSGKTSAFAFMHAFKFSLSLGLAVLFGLAYSRKNGFWAGLPVAISYAAAREATFTVANAKAQGTVLGTVYGVIGCALFHHFPLKFISLVPWFLFSSLLMKSRMYGRAGGVSAAIGAVLILGRRNFGQPSEIAIARIVETLIGLSCSIVAEMTLGPNRASSMARAELKNCFKALRESIAGLTGSKPKRSESLTKLRKCVHQLGLYIDEATVEPSFWFSPFNCSCYRKLHESLLKLFDLMHFKIKALGQFEEELTKLEVPVKETLDKLYGDINLFGLLIGAPIKRLEEAIVTKSKVVTDEKLEKGGDAADIELGEKSGKSTTGSLNSCADVRNLVRDAVGSYLEHSREVTDVITDEEKGRDTRRGVALSLSCMGYCMGSFIGEIGELEKAIQELIPHQI